MSHKDDRKRFQVVVLCEDENHYNFIRWYMIKMGFHNRKFFPKVSPLGEGSGKDFVEKNYATEVQAYRRKNYLNLILVIVIDADEKDVNGIKNELDVSLGRERRELDENIAIFVPKWHIETWMFYLEKNEEVDETERYKNKINISPKQAAEKLYEICKNSSVSLPENIPPSLKIVCTEELERLRFKVNK